MGWFLLLLGILMQPVGADTAHTLTLEAGAGPVDVPYSVAEPQLLTVTASAVDTTAEPALDVTLEILLDETRLVFNDDHQSDTADLQASDAQLAAVRLLEPGTYTLRVHTFSGAQSGDVQVSISTAPLIAACPLDGQTVTLVRFTAFRCVLDLSPAERVTITARDVSGGLDPLLALAAATGERVAQNDDHGSRDFTLNTLDARIADYSADAAGTYTLTLRDFSGRTGNIELIFDISS